MEADHLGLPGSASVTAPPPCAVPPSVAHHSTVTMHSAPAALCELCGDKDHLSVPGRWQALRTRLLILLSGSLLLTYKNKRVKIPSTSGIPSTLSSGNSHPETREPLLSARTQAEGLSLRV